LALVKWGHECHCGDGQGWKAGSPEKIRESLHLVAGARFEVTEQDDGIFLRPLQSLPTLIRRSGVLVMSAGSPSNYDILQMVEDDRQSRMQQISDEPDGYPEAHKVVP
jgi:bifunctional DNA-binding transcriptional regulator/antitoxin component of YhaV-PrlF toxin-antitoxin module